MSGAPHGERSAGDRPGVGGLFVVAVREAVASALTGHDERCYVSAPQNREQALELVALLLGYPAEPANGEASWGAPILGGKRIVPLSEGGAVSYRPSAPRHIVTKNERKRDLKPALKIIGSQPGTSPAALSEAPHPARDGTGGPPVRLTWDGKELSADP